ncbi:MAG: hypothetical protein ACYTG3_17505 [Planctomycetota bacterium]|jgi:hypothetical protein
MRWTVVAAAAVAFLVGSQLAGGAPKHAVGPELLKRQKKLFLDLDKIRIAAKDIVELREIRESGKFILNHEEKKLEKQSRMDFHIFMERARNDTLEVLRIYDRVLKKQDYVDPIRRKFGRALDEIITVNWDEEAIEDVVGEIADAYNVRLNISGDLDYRKTISLNGEMSLMAVLLYLENLWDAELVVKDGKLWFIRTRAEVRRMGDEEDE